MHVPCCIELLKPAKPDFNKSSSDLILFISVAFTLDSLSPDFPKTPEMIFSF